MLDGEEESAAGPWQGAAAGKDAGDYKGPLDELNGLPAASYAASRIKRSRATKSEMEHRAEALIEIVERSAPCTVRQVFYQAAVHGIVEKSEDGYAKVQRHLVELRRAGLIPFSSIADNTRWRRKPITFDNITEAIEHAAQSYRRSVWSEVDTYVEVWLEKDALAGVLMPVTEIYDIPLMVSRGYSSLTYLHEAATYMRGLGKKVVILHFGDWDPSGQDAAEKIEARLREFAPDVEIHFQRCAVTPNQIEHWRLPSRPTKGSDSRSKKWKGGASTDLDAIEARMLRRLCRARIEGIIPEGWLKTLQVAEESERAFLTSWAAAAGALRQS